MSFNSFKYHQVIDSFSPSTNSRLQAGLDRDKHMKESQSHPLTPGLVRCQGPQQPHSHAHAHTHSHAHTHTHGRPLAEKSATPHSNLSAPETAPSQMSFPLEFPWYSPRAHIYLVSFVQHSAGHCRAHQGLQSPLSISSSPLVRRAGRDGPCLS